ncbi:nitroreductase [Jatrophihabitans sp. DSM 45814]
MRPDEVLESLFRERYSCRAFRPDRVQHSLMSRMFEIAQLTPSWNNSQPWQTIVTSGTGTTRFRERLYDAAESQPQSPDLDPPAEYRGKYLQRRRETGYALYNALGIDRSDREARQRQLMRNFRFFDAPHVAVITSDTMLGSYGYVDCGAYIDSLLLAAQSLGLAAVPQAAIAMYSAVVRKHFSISDDRAVVCAVSFGYAADTAVNKFRTRRETVESVVQWIDD